MPLGSLTDGVNHRNACSEQPDVVAVAGSCQAFTILNIAPVFKSFCNFHHSAFAVINSLFLTKIANYTPCTLPGVKQCFTACRVSPVYKHIFPLSTAPTLAIIGLPWKVVPFPEFELQAKWMARVLSRRVSLPIKQDMQADTEAFYDNLQQQGVPVRSAATGCN